MDEILDEIKLKMRPPKFKIIAVWPPLDPSRPCVIEVDDEIISWLGETFIEGTDYTISRTLKGVWAEMSMDTFTMLTLKWTK